MPPAKRPAASPAASSPACYCTDLQTQRKQAYWNVKGPSFIVLHELFDEINETVEDYVDDIAEQAVQLGGVAEGTARLVAKRSSLSE
jgi:starvation-inducible DNA-binding protein